MALDSPPAEVALLDNSASPWRGRLVHWKDRSTWSGAVDVWLQPHWRKGALARLNRLKPKDLCWDDSDWLDVVLAPRLARSLDAVIAGLAEDLDGAVLRAFHGCRVPDAGVFHREGLRLNDPADREAELRRIVAEEEGLAWLRPSVESRLGQFDGRERDTGRLYVCADDQPQLDRIGHYMLYGSEWITAFLGFSAHRVLRRRGVPTMVELDVPFSQVAPATRLAFARKLLQEWVRVRVNGPNFTPKLDFTVVLRAPLPPQWVVGHYHPAALKDPFRGFAEVRTDTPACPSCRR